MCTSQAKKKKVRRGWEEELRVMDNSVEIPGGGVVGVGGRRYGGVNDGGEK